jgi:hypothetical protein
MQSTLASWLDDRRVRFSECEEIDARILVSGLDLELSGTFVPRRDLIVRQYSWKIGPSSISNADGLAGLTKALGQFEAEILARIRPPPRL